MGYWVRMGAGLGLIVAGVAVTVWSIVGLFDIGSCGSSTSSFAVAGECPDSVGFKVGAIFPAGTAVWIGAWLFAIRGGRATAPGLPPKA